jgi:hypothetical protein
VYTFQWIPRRGSSCKRWAHLPSLWSSAALPIPGCSIVVDTMTTWLLGIRIDDEKLVTEGDARPWRTASSGRAEICFNFEGDARQPRGAFAKRSSSG